MKKRRAIIEDFEILTNEELNLVRGGTTDTDGTDDGKKDEGGEGNPDVTNPDVPVIDPNPA
jgi:hypothetical protein